MDKVSMMHGVDLTLKESLIDDPTLKLGISSSSFEPICYMFEANFKT